MKQPFLLMTVFIIPLSNSVFTDYLMACTGGRCKGSESGSIVSPNFPLPYPSKSDVNYTLETTRGDVIQLSFDKFKLEFDTECAYDKVSIYDSDGSLLLDPLCGDELPPVLTSAGSKMTILFTSDTDVESLGFAARWKRIKNPRQGNLLSPGYPGQYPKCFLDRVAVIEAPKNSKIFLRLLDFQLERNYDYVLIMKGVKSTEDTYIGTYYGCGQYDSDGENVYDYPDYYYYYYYYYYYSAKNNQNRRKIQDGKSKSSKSHTKNRNKSKSNKKRGDKNKGTKDADKMSLLKSKLFRGYKNHLSEYVEVLTGTIQDQTYTIDEDAITIFMYSDSSVTDKGFNIFWSIMEEEDTGFPSIIINN